jgi:hypothetical protein
MKQEGNMEAFAAVENAILFFMLIGLARAQEPTGAIAGA